MKNISVSSNNSEFKNLLIESITSYFRSKVSSASWNSLTYNILLKTKPAFHSSDFYLNLEDTLVDNILRTFLILSPYMFDFKKNLETRKKLYELTVNLIGKEQGSHLLCIGDGYIGEGTTMIVGMAPGFYNDSNIDRISYPFKPSFYFAQTSKILRIGCTKAIENIYFTNLSKFVFEKNYMDANKYQELYEKYYSTFKEELDILKPNRIIALGRDVYNFLKNDKIETEYLYHPSYFVYRKQYKDGQKYYSENI